MNIKWLIKGNNTRKKVEIAYGREKNVERLRNPLNNKKRKRRDGKFM
jgi:hypothetical protein